MMKSQMFRIVASVTVCGAITLLGSVTLPVRYTSADDRAQSSPGDTKAAPVSQVTVSPSTDPNQPGNMSITATINPGAIVLPPGTRTGHEPRVRDGRLTRVLKLESKELTGWQQNYVHALDTATDVLDIHGPGQFRKKAKSAARRKAETVKSGAATTLVPFEGLPPLTPGAEQLIIHNCLMITNLKVVENTTRTQGKGVWTFAHLIDGLANPSETGISPSDFVKKWLSHWQKDQSINGYTIPNRKDGIEQLILNSWPRVSGSGDLDLEKAPFRLLAIVSRLDLRDNLVLGAERIGGGGAGEARFVFCAVDKDGAPLAFTVIFEYGIKKRDYQAVRDWALQWYDLKDKQLGSEEYNAALERITEQFAGAGTDQESPPNRSSLSQLRTNEIALVADPRINPTPRRSQAVWEIREFRIDVENTGQLRQVTVKQTPDLIFNDPLNLGDQAVLAQFINTASQDILNKRHRTPVAFAPQTPGQGFLTGSAITPPNVFWNAPRINNPEARHLFSLGTCNGCHAAEAFPKFPALNPKIDDLKDPERVPPHFTHVRPRQAGREAKLSPFLTGRDEQGQPYMLPDPSGQKNPANPQANLTRSFHDLSDRANDLRGIVEYGTYYELWRAPSQRVH
jgi:hypothetical protein